MSVCCAPGNAAKKLCEWLAAGAKGRLILHKEDFSDGIVSLQGLLFYGSLRERLTQNWRSFCAWIGRYTPFSGWKEFWFRRAGVRIGKNVYFSPGVEIDLLLPQLITLEDNVVVGMGALIVAHIYTPEMIVVERATIKRGGLLGGRAVLAATSIGENAILGAVSCAMKPVPDGHTAVGMPAVNRKRRIRPGKEEKENDDRA